MSYISRRRYRPWAFSGPGRPKKQAQAHSTHIDLFPRISAHVLIYCVLQVGDGLEVYIVVAKDSPNIQGVQGIPGLQEATSADEGERVFVVRRNLKRD